MPHYLDKKNLICPFLRIMDPDVVREREQAVLKTGKEWSSYFLFPTRMLDGMRDRGQLPVGYSDVLRERGGDTPLVICRAHREPDYVAVLSGVTHNLAKPRWFFPEAPVIVLRWDGRVQTTRKGGSMVDLTSMGAIQDLAEL